MKRSADFLPALRFRWLTPLYDPVLRWVMQEGTFKRHLVEQAKLGAGARVLDLGCGTGTLTILAKQMHPEAEITGLTPTPRYWPPARAKAERVASTSCGTRPWRPALIVVSFISP